jgi:RIO kinase 1
MSQFDGLTHLVEEGIIDAVHARLMSGKEATVYVVEREGHLGAAKVYKTRDERTFKKTASYVEGRNQTRNSRDRRAMQNKSAYGRGLIEDSWQDMEFHALRAAFDAGVRVPEPYFLYENVLFMELVVDTAGAPASRLADFSFTAEEATRLHQEVFLQVRTLLGTGRIHGDLSAYNVLMAAKGPTIIDMPQVVEVAGNNNARQILRRDLRNVTEHLARYDARLLHFADCGDALFHHLLRGTLDTVVGPEAGAPVQRGGAGRRGRDAERGRAGRDKSRGQRPGPGIGAGPAPARRPDNPAPPVAAQAGGPSREYLRARSAPSLEPRAREPRAGEPRAGETRTGETRAGEPRAGEPRAGQPPSPTGTHRRRRRRGGR